jgi:putative membrane protein
MGAADIIPGVSGGTIALITGIYPRLITGIDNMLVYGASALRRFISGSFDEARSLFLKIDFPFFIPLFLGIAASFLSLAHLIHYLLENQVALVYSFFFGLILASCIFVLRDIATISVKTVVSFLGGFIFAFVFVAMNPIEADHSLPVIFFSGSFAICAMLLPGISGSFLLVFLGQYEYMLSALKGLVIPTTATFVLGAAAGLAMFSRIIDYLLTHHRPMTLSFITGLMVGSLRLPWTKVASTEFSLVPVLGLGAFGFLLVFILELVFRKN